MKTLWMVSQEAGSDGSQGRVGRVGHVCRMDPVGHAALAVAAAAVGKLHLHDDRRQ